MMNAHTSRTHFQSAPTVLALQWHLASVSAPPKAHIGTAATNASGEVYNPVTRGSHSSNSQLNLEPF